MAETQSVTPRSSSDTLDTITRFLEQQDGVFSMHFIGGWWMARLGIRGQTVGIGRDKIAAHAVELCLRDAEL